MSVALRAIPTGKARALQSDAPDAYGQAPEKQCRIVVEASTIPNRLL